MSAGEHYARTDTGELIGPYATVGECERERLESNAEALELAREAEPHEGHFSLWGSWYCDTCDSPYCELA
jgi:hypothetical protein